MSRFDMSELEWQFIKCMLPNKSRGVKRVDDRRVINGIFYALRTGCPWRDHCPAVHVYMHERVPERYGPYTTVYNRFNRWAYAGIWDQIMDAVVDAHNGDVVMIDGTSVRVHHAAATLKKTIHVDVWGAQEVD